MISCCVLLLKILGGRSIMKRPTHKRIIGFLTGKVPPEEYYVECFYGRR
jgi:hypothetical protein